MILELSNAEYEQLTVDLEQAMDELTELSRRVDWYCSEIPSRLEEWIGFLKQAKDSHEAR